MRKIKILFVFEQYKYNDNKILTLKNLSFLSIISFIIILRLFKIIVKNKSDENNFDINFSKNISNKKKLTSTFKAFKEMKIKKFNFIDIIKIDASTYYHLTRKKKTFFFDNK